MELLVLLRWEKAGFILLASNMNKEKLARKVLLTGDEGGTRLQHADYEILTPLQIEAEYRIYRAVRRRDNGLVLLSCVEGAERFKRDALLNEYELLSGVHSPQVMNVLDMEQSDDGWFLVWEDFTGASLETWLGKVRPDLEQAIEIALSAAEGLSDLHQRRIMHGSLRPDNVLYNPADGKLKLWGIKDKRGAAEQEPAYWAPEQTGRMRGSVDWRADLYALGLLLYRLLAGQLPFQAETRQEWIHCHMAVRPLPLDVLCPKAPKILVDLVLRLLAKDPNDRYQSAAGVAYDLQHCLQQWREKKAIPPFILAGRDALDVLRVPEKIYGRGSEMDALLAALVKADRMESQNVLLAGYSGVGKSTLVKELQWPVLEHGGLFGEGKFQELHRSQPYSAWRDAFAEICGQLQARPSEELAALREKLRVILGEGAEALFKLLPEGESLLGNFELSPALEGAEEEKRLFIAAKRFLQVVAEAGRPVVLLLDDLQWADQASLKLFAELSQTQAALVLIGAYRANELGNDQFIALWLNEADCVLPNLTRLELKEHSYEVVREILTDVLGANGSAVEELARLLYARTHGNILFLERLLEKLRDEGILFFSREDGAWQWQLAAIEQLPASENVVDLMLEKLRNLPQATLELIIPSACMGNHVSRETLAAIVGKQVWQIAAALRIAVVEGLLQSKGDGYCFTHEKIRQAAYSLLEPEAAGLLHLQIARRLYESLEPPERGRRIFELAGQWNLASQMLVDAQEIRRGAIINLEAGRRAKAGAAYRASYAYYAAGAALLGETSWERDYELQLALYTEGAEAACLSGVFAQAEAWAEIVIANASVELERVPAYEVKIQSRIAQSRPHEAVAVGLEALALLGMVLPVELRLDEVWPEMDRVQATLGGRGLKELEELPRLSEPVKLAMSRILTRIGAPAHQTSLAVFIMVICRLVEISLRSGNSNYAAYGYVAYGGILAGVYNHVEAAYRFGRLALAISKRYQASALRTKILYVFGAYILHWREKVKDTMPVLEEAYQSAWETGDFEYGAYAAAQRLQYAFYAGDDLTLLRGEMLETEKILLRWNQARTALWNKAFLGLVIRLQDEDAAVKLCEKEVEADSGYEYHACFCRFSADYLLGEVSEATLLAAESCRLGLTEVTALYVTAIFHFYDSLLRLSLSGEDEIVAENQRKLWRWAQHAPDNYLHKYYLVEAERLRIAGRWEEAGDLYDQAAALARQCDFLGEEALAWELGGRFFLAEGKDVVGRAYIEKSYALYESWGATAKSRRLRKEFPFIEEKNSPERSGLDSSDWLAAFEAARILAKERDIARLTGKMTRILLENSGAQRVCFLSILEGGFAMKAEGVAGEPPLIMLSDVLKVSEPETLPLTVLRYVLSSRSTLWLESAEDDRRFRSDAYVRRVQLKSALCLPVGSQGALMGVLYLENNNARGVFTAARIRLLEFIAAQLAVGLESAYLWRELEERVAQRTQELEKAVEAQVKSERRFRVLAEYAADVIWTLSPEALHFTYASPAVFRLTGWMPEELRGKSGVALIAEENKADFNERLLRLTANYQGGLPEALRPERWDCRFLRKDGSQVEVENVVSLLIDKDGGVEALLGISRDITERKTLEAELVMLATTDMMTGIANRRHFVELVQEELQRSRRYKSQVALLVMDLDKFKDVNDTYGHPCGDEVLRQFAQLCRKSLRNCDHLGRIGGEEFAALLPETTLPAAKIVAERVREAMEKNRVSWEGSEVACTVSIGVTVIGGEDESWESFLGRADRALYTAKRSGRNRVDCL